MDEKKPLIQGRSRKLDQYLAEIKLKGDLPGVMLVSREGNVVSNNFKEELDKTTFSAMCASVLESADTLRDILSEKSTLRITTELDNRSFIVIKCSNSLFLVLFIGESSNIDPVLEEMDNYINKIILIQAT